MAITAMWFMTVAAAAAVAGTALTGAAVRAGGAPPRAGRAPAVAGLRAADGPGAHGPPGGAGCADGRCWPVAGLGPRGRPEVLRGFEPPPAPWAAGHRGVDLRAGPGTGVRAAGGGRVVFAGPVGGTPVVVVALPGRLRVTYEPVRATVRVGAPVAAGDRVGVVAGVLPHCRAAPCLHWGLLRDGGYLDPLGLLPPALMRAGPSRLLPVLAALTG